MENQETVRMTGTTVPAIEIPAMYALAGYSVQRISKAEYRLFFDGKGFMPAVIVSGIYNRGKWVGGGYGSETRYFDTPQEAILDILEWDWKERFR